MSHKTKNKPMQAVKMSSLISQEKSMKVHKNKQSACYVSYHPSQLFYQFDKNGSWMITYPCKTWVSFFVAILDIIILD